MIDPFGKTITRDVDTLWVHCTASNSPSHDNIETIDAWHKARGWNGIGYHYLISSDGTLKQGRDINLTPAAQSGHNMGAVAVVLQGLYNGDFTEAQFETLRELCVNYRDNLGNTDLTFHGHNEVAAKACPVFDYKTVLKINKDGKCEL